MNMKTSAINTAIINSSVNNYRTVCDKLKSYKILRATKAYRRLHDESDKEIFLQCAQQVRSKDQFTSVKHTMCFISKRTADILWINHSIPERGMTFQMTISPITKMLSCEPCFEGNYTKKVEANNAGIFN